MFFHVAASHLPADCPHAAQDESKWNATFGRFLPGKEEGPKAWAGQHGVTTHCVAVCGPEHKVFMIVEARDVEGLFDFLHPIKSISNAEVTPLRDVGFPHAGG